MPLMRSVPSVWAKLSNVRSHFAIRLMESFSSGSVAGIKRTKFCCTGPLDLLKKNLSHTSISTSFERQVVGLTQEDVFPLVKKK